RRDSPAAGVSRWPAPMKRLLVAMLLFAAACGGPTGQPVQVRIPEGATLSATADTLAAHGVLSSPTFFRIYARVLGKADEIKAGVYRIPPGLSTPRLVGIITSGRAALRR